MQDQDREKGPWAELMKDKRGFTLMEVLVAISILGIGLGIILELFSGGLRSAKISEEVTKAVWYGQSKMEELLNTKELSEGTTEDAFDAQFAWKTEIKKANPPLGLAEKDPAPLPIDLYQILVKVTWQSGKNHRSFELESLRAYKTEAAGK
jgi:general secretion pathway protein I